MRCSGEFAPGEETLLGIEPGKFHQANLSIIDNLFTRPRLKLPKTRRKRRKALHRLYKQDRSRAAALIVSGEWRTLDKSTQQPMDTLKAFWQPLLETSTGGLFHFNETVTGDTRTSWAHGSQASQTQHFPGYTTSRN